MVFLDSLLGNVSEVQTAEVREDIEPLLAQQEEIDAVVAVLRDLLVFTTGRLIKVNKQGVTGKKS